MRQGVKWGACYFAGILIWLLLLAAMPTAGEIDTCITLNLIHLSVGLFIGLKGRHILENHPWLLIFIPGVPLLFGLFGV